MAHTQEKLTQVTPPGLHITFIKQLLDEVEHDIMNDQNPRSVLSAEAEG